MKLNPQIATLAAAMLLVFGLTACDSRTENAAEDAGDKIEDAAEKTADKMEDAADKVEDKLD